jgi:hypothetical protein
MQIARYSTLLVAAAIASPALWAAFVTHEMDVTTALLRFLVAVPIAAILLAVLDAVTKGYGRRDPVPPPDRVQAEAVTGEPLQRRSDD